MRLGSSFRKFLGTLLFFLTIAIASRAQLTQRSELGFGLGTFNYTGDLARTYNFAFSKPAATILYRLNLSQVVSFRTSFTGGKVGASDKAHPLDAFAAKRAASFNIFLLELSGVFEYHFLDWRDEKRHLRFTPYLFAGVGLFSITGNAPKTAEYSNVQLSIPFGGGIKYVLNPRWYLALDLGISSQTIYLWRQQADRPGPPHRRDVGGADRASSRQAAKSRARGEARASALGPAIRHAALKDLIGQVQVDSRAGEHGVAPKRKEELLSRSSSRPRPTSCPTRSTGCRPMPRTAR